MTTLITGGAGFIGSRLALSLLADDEPIVILDNFDAYYDPKIKRENIAALGALPVVIEGDVRDEATVAHVFNQHNITRVAHMAGMSNVRYSAERGRLYADVNTSATVSLMDEARKHQVSVFVFGSTSSVYGNTVRIPFVEDDAAAYPLAPYPASKRAAEIYAYTYFQLFGLNVNILRFFNVYGPHGRPDMMPLRVIEAILHGDAIDLWDGGELQRDWTYIDDIVDGIKRALDRPLGYQIMNLGYGSPITLNEFVHIYEDLIGKAAVTRVIDAPLTEPKITYCDNARAVELLGFAPKVGIAEGLAHTWDWYCERYSIQQT
ncbi:MAG: NAD-dependent epimerase/dehydratase family protein [Chloroflexi bacterium]|nr:NAD-dependent epimerase/dehydratase family protein [Chloroflexota bacterium]